MSLRSCKVLLSSSKAGKNLSLSKTNNSVGWLSATIVAVLG